MFTENEIASLIARPKILEKVQPLREDFIKTEAQFLEINDHDFLSLMIICPSVGIALANGSVSLFEEISLNKKARKLSKGGYWMKKDPVVVAMGYLIKHYEDWNNRFYQTLKDVMELTYDKEKLMNSTVDDPEVSDEEFCFQGLKTPFIFIRYLTSFFLDDEEEDLVADRNLSQVERDRIIEIGEKLGFTDIPIFNKFVTKLNVR